VSSRQKSVPRDVDTVEEENMPIKEKFAVENRMFFLFLNRRQKRNSRKEKKVIKVFRNKVQM